MIANKDKMEEWKLLSFFSLLSNYNYFSVQKESEPVFHATGVERSCGWVLKFERKFATPVYSEGELTNVIALSKTEFQCQCGEFTYHIRALHEKPDELPMHERKQWKRIFDLAHTEYINPDKSQYIKESDLLVLVVDPDLLGELTPIEETQIKHLINIQLRGNTTERQICRSIHFSCKIHNDHQAIYVGMYDLENSIPATSIMVYNNYISQSMSDDAMQKYQALWEMAQKIYREKFEN